MIAIIPARGGSKGIPNKNIRKILGQPLILYTIEAAQNAKSIQKILISTDSKKIAEICLEYDVEIPFIRPKYLASDNSKAIDNYIYTINRLNNEFNENYEEFVVLQPTSPLRTAKDIDNAIDVFRKRNADSVISVCKASFPPIWAKRIDENGILQNFFNLNEENKNRQELDTAYVPNGAVFVFKYSLLKERNTYYSEKTYPYIMPREYSIDIDDFFDFEIAEFLLSKKNL